VGFSPGPTLSHLDLQRHPQLRRSLHGPAHQPLDRGDLAAWRELYHLAAADDRLRRRLLAIVRRVPLPYPRFWLAALGSLGEAIDWTAVLPEDSGIA
jgi:hypothetical protein